MISRMIYPGVISIFSGVASIASRIWIVSQGRGDDTPSVLASNHISVFDPLYLSSVNRRRISFFANDGLARNSLLALFFDALHVIPVHRNALNLKAIRCAKRRLRDGYDIGVFLEGGINMSHRTNPSVCINPGNCKNGAVFLSKSLRANIIPTAVYGTYDLYLHKHRVIKRPNVVISFGRPIRPDDLPKSHTQSTIEVAGTIQALYSETRMIFGNGFNKGLQATHRVLASRRCSMAGRLHQR